MNLGKRILAAFVEVQPDTALPESAIPPVEPAPAVSGPGDPKFRAHFDQLIAEGNQPGPDYFEFRKMTEAMSSIPDEKARYLAAFAGLQAQGLDRTTLLSTARTYLSLLEEDAERFRRTAEEEARKKVTDRQNEVQEKTERIRLLSEEIIRLQADVTRLQIEISENEARIGANTAGYRHAAEEAKHRILADIEKINQHLS